MQIDFGKLFFMGDKKNIQVTNKLPYGRRPDDFILKTETILKMIYVIYLDTILLWMNSTTGAIQSSSSEPK